MVAGRLAGRGCVVFCSDGRPAHGLLWRQQGLEKKTLEMLLCGALTLTFSSALEYLGLPKTLSVALGGATGLTGVDTIRALVMNYLAKRLGPGNGKEKV